MKVVKSFYGMPKAGNHWFIISYNYHINLFGITELIYNFYLLYRYNFFDIIGLQINNIFIVVSNTFITMKKKFIKTAKLIFKEQPCFFYQILIKFKDN